MDIRYIPIFLFGLFGGGIAYVIGLPMPFMLGSIVGAASFVLVYERNGKELPKLSRWVRMIFAAVIGAMIGSRFSPEFLTLLPQFWLSIPAILVFILAAHGGNYLIMRRLGHYEKRDAYFAALPGGIVDAAILAEQAGADLRVVTAQHFIRIILVVVTVPLLFWLVQGDAVGSLAGESFATAEYDHWDIIYTLMIAAAGLFLGRKLHVPVAHLVGPLVLGLVLSVSGVVSINLPEWLQHLAQFMLGTTLGAQFSGVSRKLLARSFGTGLLSGAYMMVLAALFASILIQYVPADFPAIFISFAAGGLLEMSLIALSLNFNPVVVALHHIVRIFFTIGVGNALSRRLFPGVKKP